MAADAGPRPRHPFGGAFRLAGVDPDAPGQLRYWDGRCWTQYATPRRTPQAIPGLKQTPPSTNRTKAWLTALAAALLIIALIAVSLPHNDSAERPTTGVGPTTTSTPSRAKQSSPTSNAPQSAVPPPVIPATTATTQPTNQSTPIAPAVSPSSGSSTNPSSSTSAFVSDLTQVGEDETAIANNAGSAESSGNLTQVGSECGTLTTNLGALRGDTAPNTLTPIEESGLTNIESDLTNAANDCAQGVDNHEMSSIIAAVNQFSSAGSLINQLNSELLITRAPRPTADRECIGAVKPFPCR